MSDVRANYPPETPQPPYFRGVSFLAGGVGDLLYGYYGRSVNTMVADATSMEKRSGYVRAFDEVFCGRAAAVHHREPGLNYTIAADGTGIKVITALVPKRGGGNRFEHVSYPVDDFNRADNTTVNTSLTGGNKYWREAWSPHASSIGTTYSGWQVASNTCKVAHDSAGSLDIKHPTPSPYYVQRLELDLSNFDPDGSANSFFGAHLAIGHGLPLAQYDTSGTLLRYDWSIHDTLARHTETRFGPAGFGTGHSTPPWMGALWDFRIIKSVGGVYRLHIKQHHFFSSRRTTDAPDTGRDGRMAYATGEKLEFVDLSDLQQKHYIEVGRVAGAGGKVMTSFNFWKGKNATSAPLNSPDISGARIQTEIDKEPSAHPGYYFVVTDPQGQYGHAAIWGRNEDDTSGDVVIDNSIVAGGFLA